MRNLLFIFIILFFDGCLNTSDNTDIVNDTIADLKTNSIDSVSVAENELDQLMDSIIYDYNSGIPILDSDAVGINYKTKGSYQGLKYKIVERQAQFKATFITLSDSTEINHFIDSVGTYLTSTLLNDIFPFWYGTEWDYNGITETPGEGVVACGYFVSTTFKHIGFNLNRYKFAQQSGLVGAKSLQMGEPIKKFYPKENIDIIVQLISKLKPGLYKVGLSCHVGYLLIRNNRVFFIHSNYIHTGVMIEEAKDSDAFVSGIYVVSDISYNKKLIRKWIMGERIEIIK